MERIRRYCLCSRRGVGLGYGNGVKSDEEFLERFGGLIEAVQK
ncbi:MAG: hypothetical protein ACLRSW_08725 [Christensenellaceae bacterium]